MEEIWNLKSEILSELQAVDLSSFQPSRQDGRCCDEQSSKWCFSIKFDDARAFELLLKLIEQVYYLFYANIIIVDLGSRHHKLFDIVMVHWCCMCKVMCESVDHLLLIHSKVGIVIVSFRMPFLNASQDLLLRSSPLSCIFFLFQCCTCTNLRQGRGVYLVTL